MLRPKWWLGWACITGTGALHCFCVGWCRGCPVTAPAGSSGPTTGHGWAQQTRWRCLTSGTAWGREGKTPEGDEKETVLQRIHTSKGCKGGGGESNDHDLTTAPSCTALCLAEGLSGTCGNNKEFPSLKACFKYSSLHPWNLLSHLFFVVKGVPYNSFIYPPYEGCLINHTSIFENTLVSFFCCQLVILLYCNLCWVTGTFFFLIH